MPQRQVTGYDLARPYGEPRISCYVGVERTLDTKEKKPATGRVHARLGPDLAACLRISCEVYPTPQVAVKCLYAAAIRYDA